MPRRFGILGKAGFVAAALVSVTIGARAVNFRELYREMYPLEPVKQDAFQICSEEDQTFVRAIGAEREACYKKMPHIMAVAMGRVKPSDALTLQALSDPSREAELLMLLASLPPRQPITAPRSFSNTAWVKALSPPCDDKQATPALAYAASVVPPPSAGTGRAAALDSTIRNNLPPLPRPGQGPSASPTKPPVITLGPVAPPIGAQASQPGDKTTTANPAPAPAPDIGDSAPPAIVPLASTTSCGGA
ncbi:MAG TPA: hypothetical protein VM782_02720 [Stellaceae bacterium]|nr:hypothetical protein [Stellaceae bacterium]